MRELPFETQIFLQVLNNLNLGVYITDLDRRIVLANRNAETITGYKAADVVNTRSCSQMFVCKDKTGRSLCPTRRCPLIKAIKTAQASDHAAMLLTSSGGLVPVSVNVGPLCDENRTVIGGIHIFREDGKMVSNLSTAQRILSNVMETTPPTDHRVRFKVGYFPHDLVGGDFYNIRKLDVNRYGVMVADIVGHGVAAAVYTLLFKSLVGAAAGYAPHPDRFFKVLNKEIGKFTLPEHFATALYGVIDTESWEFTYSNAGHPPAFHCHRDARGWCLNELCEHDCALGMFKNGEYGNSIVRVEEGDILLCYTDGIMDVFEPRGGRSSRSRLGDFVIEELSLGPEHDLGRLYHRVLESCDATASPDDVLLLSIERVSGEVDTIRSPQVQQVAKAPTADEPGLCTQGRNQPRRNSKKDVLT